MTRRITRLIAASREWGRRAAACLGARPFLWSCGLATAVTAVSAGALSPSLYMSDDVSMAAFVDGSYSGEPVPYMVYTNVAVGLLLHSLYNLAGSVPWYGIYLMAAHSLALAVILYVVLADRRPDRGWRLLAVAAWLALFGLWMGTQITFTQVAMLLGSAGMLLYFSRAPLAQVRGAVVVAAGALIGAAFLMRAQSLWAVGVLSLPLLFLVVRRIPWRRQVLFGATAAAVVLFGWAAQTAYYAAHPNWQEYLTFNTARGRLEWSVEQGVVDDRALSAAGWSENDLAMFSIWSYADPDVYTTERFQQVVNAARHPLLSPFDPREGLDRMQWWGGFDVSLVALGLALTAALAGTAWDRGGRLTRRFIILSAVWFGAVATALLAQLKLPARVAFPMLAFFALLLLALPEAAAPDAGLRPGRLSNAVRATAAVAAAAVLIAGLAHAVAGVGQRRADHEIYGGVLAAFAELDPEGTFVYLSAATYYGRPSPWQAPMAPSSPMISFGWFQRTPLFDRQMAGRGIDDFYLAIGSREDIYLPLSDEWEALVGQPYLTFLEEHHAFTGLLRPRADQGSYFARDVAIAIFDLAVAYEVNDSAGVLVERRPDASEIRYPIIEDAIVGGTYPCAVSTVLRGWAGDPERGGPVDHVVAFSDDRAITVTIPTTVPPTLAALRRLTALGFTDPDRLGFELNAAGVSDPGVRVFALSNGRATEITEAEAPAQPSPPAKAPALTLEELAERRYAALNAEDNEALLALNAVGAFHFDYLVEGPAGVIHRSFLVAEHDATSEDQAVEVLGEPIVSGNTVAVPVRYRYSCGEATGFDVLAAERTASGGLLIARSATHYAARPAAGVNPAVVQDLIAAQTAAWTAGDVDGVLATYGENAAYIEVLTGYVYTGGTLRSFFADRSLEFTGPPVISGSFAAVPTRTTDRGTGLAEDGVSIYWIRDGKIVLHSYAQGA